MGVFKGDNRWVVPLTSAITFLGFVDTHLLIPVIALYAAGLGAGIGTVGLIVGLYSIVNTPANIISGRLIDRVGYRSPLIGGLGGNLLSMVLYALARSPLQLAMVRVLHGVSGALVGPATMSIIAHHSLNERRGRSMSRYGMALASASLVGYPLSGVIASRLGLSAVFLVGAGLVGAGMLVSLALPGGSGLPGGTQVRGGAIERIRALLTARQLAPAYAAMFAQYFTFGGVVTLLPAHVEKLGMGAFEVGMLLATFSAVFVFTQLPGGVISDSAGRRSPMLVGLACIMSSLLALPRMGSFGLLAAAMAVYGLGYGLLFPSASALVADGVEVGERGLAMGLFHALLTAGVAVGAPLTGLVAGHWGLAAGLLITPVPVAVAFVLCLILLSRTS
jgi:MFS family permease